MADVLSDAEFSSLNPNDVMQEIDNSVNQYEKELEAYQNTQREQYQEPAQEQANTSPEPTLEQQANFGVEQQNNVPEQYVTSSQDTNNDDIAIYKQAYEKITSPFKASGREFQVRNIDEAISLMQKGVDYTRKQQALKPRLVEMRTLEDQGMLGNNLNYAIDLYNGNPQALAKLIKDKGIDINKLVPQTTNEFGETIDAPETPYTPNNYTISPERYEFKEVTEELRRSDMFDKVADALEKFDESSKEEFRKAPKYLLSLSNLIQSGVYDKVQAELEHARLVDAPMIRNLNDFQAMDVIGRAMAQSGAFNQQPMQQPQPNQYNQVNQQQIYQQRQQQAVQNRKQQVSPVRSTPSRGPVVYDPLRCSDEEFAKIDINELMRR